MPSRLVLPEDRPLPDRAAFEEVYRHPPGPHVRVNFVASLDGAIEVDGRSGALGGEADRNAFMAMRALADVVLAGAGTVRAEDYGPVRLDAATRRCRTERGQAPLPPVAVISGSGSLDPGARLFVEATGGPRPIILTTTSAEVPPGLHERAEVVVCGETDVDPGQAIAALTGRGYRSVLCEGGPALARSLLGAGLVDELCLTFSPLLAGRDHRTLADAWSGPPLALTLLGLIEGDGLLLTRYAVTR